MRTDQGIIACSFPQLYGHFSIFQFVVFVSTTLLFWCPLTTCDALASFSAAADRHYLFNKKALATHWMLPAQYQTAGTVSNLKVT